MNMKKAQQGFTLIELMIVVAIIGILAAIAIPAYQDYIGRTQAIEGVELLGGLKTPVEEWYGTKGTMPDVTDLEEFRSQGKYVATVTGTNPYTATLKGAGSVNADIAGTTITFTYETSTGIWTCAQGTIANKFLPSSCK